MNRSSIGLGTIAVFLTALGWRLLHVAAYLRSPAGTTLAQDSKHYDLEALRIAGILPASGDTGPSFMNLGYPYFLAALHVVFGEGTAAVLGVQAVLGALAAVLLLLATRQLLQDDRLALLAGGLYALHDGGVFYDGLVLTASPVNVLMAGALLAFAIHRRSFTVAPAAIAGAAIGLASLLRASNLLLAAILAPLAVFRSRSLPREKRRRHRLGALALAGGSLLTVLPVIAYNGLVRGHWAPVSANGGMNFWVGNHTGANGLYSSAGFLANEDVAGEAAGFLEEARRRTGNPSLTLAASSSFWFRETLSDIGASPGRWVNLLFRKLLLFWNHDEPKTNVGITFVRELSLPLAASPVRFGMLAVLGLAGWALLAADRRAEALDIGLPFLLAPMVTCLVFFVSGEYRHPAILPLCVGAAFALDAVWCWTRAKLFRKTTTMGGVSARVGILFGAALLMTPLVYVPSKDIEVAGHPDIDVWNYVRELCRPIAGEEPSLERLKSADALVDRFSAGGEASALVRDAHLWVSVRRAIIDSDRAEAVAALREARFLLSRPRPSDGGAADAFSAYLEESIPARLEELSRQDFVRRDPELSREAAWMGGNRYEEVRVLFERNDLLGSEAFLRAAVERAPHNVRLQAALGQVLLAAGREAEGFSWLDRSCAGWPKIAECAYYAAVHHAARGNPIMARQAALEALRRDPEFNPARELLAGLE